MKYGKHKHVNYKLEDLQEQRYLADPEEKESIQKQIDMYFFGTKKKRKSKKERRRERRKERQRWEEDYV